MAQTGHMDEDKAAVLAALARVYQLQALLHDVEECVAAVAPEAMAALLADQSAAARGDAFARTGSWIDAVRAALAHRQSPPAPPFAPRPLRLTVEGGIEAQLGAEARHAGAARMEVAR